MVVTSETPKPIADFLRAPTPQAWIDAAVGRVPELLVDHANCELKAASTALGFIYRYPERTRLCVSMSRLAREELRHYEQVRKIMKRMAIPFERLSASRYAGGLREGARAEEPYRLMDSLLVGALIEARSCERFARLAPHLDDPLRTFYAGLLASEARHFQNYLDFAETECAVDQRELTTRLNELRDREANLVLTPDEQFRFHSGPPPFTGPRASRIQ